MTRIFFLALTTFLFLSQTFPQAQGNQPFYVLNSFSYSLENGEQRPTKLHYFWDNTFVSGVQQQIARIPYYGEHSPKETLNAEEFLYVHQHEAGCSHSEAKFPVIATDGIYDCVAGTVWNAKTRQGCVFHFDRYTSSPSIGKALFSVRGEEKNEEVSIRLFSSYLTPHLFRLINYIENIGFTIETCDTHRAFHTWGCPFKCCYSVVFDDTFWSFKDETLHIESQPFSPRKVCLDTRNGEVYTDFEIPNSVRRCSPRSRRRLQYNIVLRGTPHLLSYFNEWML